MKILSLEVFCPELQLDLVVAHLTGVHHALAKAQRDLLRWHKGQYHGLGLLRHRAWLDHHSAARQLSRIFGKYGNAGEAKDQCQYACSEHRCRSQSISYRMRCKPVRTGVISLGREIGNFFRSPTTLHQMRFAMAMPSPNEFRQNGLCNFQNRALNIGTSGFEVLC